MPLFKKETVQAASAPQDRGRLREIEKHELLKLDDSNQRVASFDEVARVGRWFLEQKFNTVQTSTLPLDTLFEQHYLAQKGSFLGKLALGSELESQYPVTVEVVKTVTGIDLKLHIVPIHFGALSVAEYSSHTDSLLALATAAAIAPQFILGLEDGLTGDCSRTKQQEKLIEVDHSTPLAAVFESFQGNKGIISTASSITGNRNLSVQQAAHLHHLDSTNATKLSRSAGTSKIAAGVPISSYLRSDLLRQDIRHALFFPTFVNEQGFPQIVTMANSLAQELPSLDFGLLATALGVTAAVVGDSSKEQKMERVLSLKSANIPLKELL